MQNKEKLPHKFFTYEKAVINFVFSFTWKTRSNTFDILADAFSSKRGWQCFELYKRPTSWISPEMQGAYHPTIISDNVRVLHRFGIVDKKTEIVSPYREAKSIKFKSTFASLTYDIRLYENGAGTLTFSADLASGKGINFEDILLTQHLATSIKHVPSLADDEPAPAGHNTKSFIKAKPEVQKRYGILSDHVLLSTLFSKLLFSIRELRTPIFEECSIVSESDQKDRPLADWQNPYVVSVLQVPETELKEKLEEQSSGTIKEIGAIAVRLTLDNGQKASEYFLDLRREYVFKSLGFFIANENDHEELPHPRLRNYSHSRKLFYTYGRRAAIAITSRFEDHPSYFAIPTFLNILEILRSRWHVGTIANLRLDETIERVSQREDINNLMQEIFQCRVLYGLFLQNPAPYLFDSGAVTEISDAAEKIFWLGNIGTELERKLEAIDKLVEVKFTQLSLSRLR